MFYLLKQSDFSQEEFFLVFLSDSVEVDYFDGHGFAGAVISSPEDFAGVAAA